jgi:hypothetical protein
MIIEALLSAILLISNQLIISFNVKIDYLPVY